MVPVGFGLSLLIAMQWVKRDMYLNVEVPEDIRKGEEMRRWWARVGSAQAFGEPERRSVSSAEGRSRSLYRAIMVEPIFNQVCIGQAVEDKTNPKGIHCEGPRATKLVHYSISSPCTGKSEPPANFLGFPGVQDGERLG
ncbi:uncharacterized protein MCYG_02346 [Microsporum canis CBS 113480]|uniref:Uncharacterized protein n=1 Tax=Arthroderma otae (strain ATCC MYA-4605 / CBS 113480) TaxID=554155 RepID=C5FJA6_ARTOC|nr:uncharacterized protein MCYG_02346 [Microsporum canis CBS 113480]EEQ29527.1 predicted protein [Microsporum canis CBS 113480]